jgi:mRNA-degrading endonuclease RelE of RelBE toxin-antitoxin system
MLNFFKDKLIKSQLKKLPPDQQQLVGALLEKNPKLFKKIGEEIKAKKKAGMDEQMASMQVMMAHKGEIQKIMQGIQKGK